MTTSGSWKARRSIHGRSSKALLFVNVFQWRLTILPKFQSSGNSVLYQGIRGPELEANNSSGYELDGVEFLTLTSRYLAFSFIIKT
jgi:hypothetical protein